MLTNINYKRYSKLRREDRNSSSYLKIKRLVLRLEHGLQYAFSPGNKKSNFYFALRYFDLEEDAEFCFTRSEKQMYTNIVRTVKLDFADALTNFFTSLYETDVSFFQTFFGFVLNEFTKNHGGEVAINYINQNIKEELLVLGFTYDGNLKLASGEPFIQKKISSVIEDELKRLNPELVDMRNGAIESLYSNQSDKARHVSSSCRALINNFLKELVPDVSEETGSSDIEKRIKKLFKDSDSTENLISETVSLIQALNKVQCKGDHATLDENLAHFVFEITEKLIFFILTNRKK